MTKNSKKNHELSLSEEMVFWTSYRYCIGRQSYVTSLADDLPVLYWDKLSDDQKRHTAADIRMCISEQLQMSAINMTYDWSVPSIERRGLEDLLDFMIKTDMSQEDFFRIKHIEFYKEGDELKTNIDYEAIPRNIVKYSTKISDLIPWMRLAELFDIDKHFIIEHNGKKYTVFKSYTNKSEKINDISYKIQPYKFVECLVNVDSMIKGVTTYILQEELNKLS